MSLLNFEKSEFKRTGEKKTFAIILGIGALVGVVAIGSTLAASINLNSGTPVEFGQGVAQTTACDDNVIVTPQSTFVNSEENADFFFNSLSVTDISSECDGKTFTIKAFKNGQNTALELYSSNGTPYSEINVKDESGSFSFVGGGLLSGDIEDVFGGFSVTIDNALVSGQDLNRITIESKDSPTVYVVGQTGPGGGTIYYVDNGAGFNCGSDFTATNQKF